MAQRGAGTIARRGKIWWVQVCINGQRIRRSSESEKYEVAERLRNKLLGQKARGELGGPDAKVTVNTVLDRYLEVCKHSVQADTRQIYEYVMDASIRPHFGKLRADRIKTDDLWPTVSSAPRPASPHQQPTGNWSSSGRHCGQPPRRARR
jgi:hypothetical protein